MSFFVFFWLCLCYMLGIITFLEQSTTFGAETQMILNLTSFGVFWGCFLHIFAGFEDKMFLRPFCGRFISPFSFPASFSASIPASPRFFPRFSPLLSLLLSPLLPPCFLASSPPLFPIVHLSKRFRVVVLPRPRGWLFWLPHLSCGCNIRAKSP